MKIVFFLKECDNNNFPIIDIVQRNPGSKKGMQLFKWGTYFSSIPN
jgi:hypothetical protein